MNVYDPDAMCRKCDQGDVATNYHKGCTQCSLCHHYGCNGGSEPHMHRYCRTCGHEWNELPVDASAPTRRA
jgi:hypothetical protein